MFGGMAGELRARHRGLWWVLLAEGIALALIPVILSIIKANRVAAILAASIDGPATNIGGRYTPRRSFRACSQTA